jgi:glycosidase
MVEKAHEKGIKIIMDMVPNHCGACHWWMKDLPYQDWINQFDEFTNTPNVFSANYDINASEYDRQLSNRGWFDRPMPDMNLRIRIFSSTFNNGLFGGLNTLTSMVCV